MSEPANGRLLHVRSLNQLTREHKLTYIGARILAESLHPSIIGTWTEEYISRKAQTSRRQVYWKHSLLKGFDRQGEPEYRKCVIGSPTTNLTEAWLLMRLSEEPVFAQHPNVFSYFWSHKNSHHMFEYFYKGYVQRESRIAQAATENRGYKILVLDLKRFYPTVDVELLRSRFARRVERSGLSSLERDTAIQCVGELTSIKNESGLPIGPPLSHALANVFLEDFDRVLSDEFPDRYFRYVDDVALVLPKSEVEAAEHLFAQVADDEGLKVNIDKSDVLTGEEWVNRVHHREQSSGDSLAQLISDLRRYLAHNSEDFERVRNLFRERGFVLPFSRLRSVAVSSSPFRRFLKSIWSQSEGLFGQNIPRPSALLERAEQLRRELTEQLRIVTKKPLPSSGTQRRWFVQDIRYLLNRSLYLFTKELRVEFLALIPDCNELRPSKAVLEALVTGNASELTKYPGPTVSSFCELWTESFDERPQMDWSSEPIKEERDGAGVLALCGLCTPPDEWVAHFSEQTSQLMVKLSGGHRPTRRSFDDFSYIDELESLFLTPNIDVRGLLNSRFDDGEDIILPTLSLGGGQSMS